jgi:hypothetical protein
MPKFVDDSVLDGALDVVATSTRLSLCSADPVNFAGIAAVSLGSVVVAPGDFTKADDNNLGGRKVTTASKSLTPSATGTAVVAVLDDGSTLLAETDVTPNFALTISELVSTGTFAWTVRDPA